MKCVFCGTEYPKGTLVCVSCNEYKGMEEVVEPKGFTTLAQALTSVMTLIDEARQFHLDNPCKEPDCDLCRGGE